MPASFMDFCSRCDAKNPAGNATCHRCGAPLLHAEAPDSPTTAGPPARPLISLRVVRADGGPEHQVQMQRDELFCGRTGDIALADDPFIADPQIRFFFAGGRLAVEDVGGGSGVFIRIRAQREVPVGGEVRVGRQRLLLEPIPAPETGAGGVMQWGSPDTGARVRAIQLLEGGTRGAAFPLREGENQLGREVGDLTFPTDGFVSGRHAVVEVRNDRVAIRDLNSSNGTFVRLAAPAYVDDGDQFLVGRELIRVDVRPAAAT